MLAGLLTAGLLAGSTLGAQTYYVRGSFNNWDTSTPMTDSGGGVYSATFSGTPGSRFDFKVATADWGSNWPGENCRTLFDAAGQATVYFRSGSIADGWNPTANRVGYADPLGFGWEVMGSFNGWSTPITMNALGGGLYSASCFPTGTGTFEFKFREAGSWDIAIGDDFSNWNHNCTVNVPGVNSAIEFKLDLPNGRWTTMVVPEPTTLSLLAGGALLLFLRRASGKA